MRNALIVLVLLMSSIAFAQPSMAPIADPEEPGHPMSALPRTDTTTSEGTATALAIGTTLAGLGLTVAAIKYESAGAGLIGYGAMMIGPSAGHLYAGEWEHALGMSALRTTASIAFMYGFLISLQTELESNGGGNGSARHTNGGSLMALGGAAYLLSTIYDIYDARHAARRSNNEHSLAIAPTVGQHDNALGFVVAGRF